MLHICINSQDATMFSVFKQCPNYILHDKFRDSVDNSQVSERSEGDQENESRWKKFVIALQLNCRMLDNKLICNIILD